MQEPRTGSLIREDPACHRVAEPIGHYSWACVQEPGNHNHWVHLSQLPKPAHSTACAPQQEKPPQWEAHTMQLENSSQSPQIEKSLCSDEDTVWFSHSVVPDSLRPHGLQHTRLPCPSLSPRACSNSWPLSRWYHPTISSSVIPFSTCPQSFPASGSFPVS